MTSDMKIALFLEQHLGHRTFAENLSDAASQMDHTEIRFVDVKYAAPLGWREHVLVPASLRDIWRARREIGNGLSDADVHVVNTQVPAVIGPRAIRSVPYIICTDITPLQYDAWAEAYAHEPDRSSLVGSLKHRWNRSVLQRAAAVVGWSNWVRSSMITDYGVDPERCHVIPPGVDTSRFAPAERRPKTVPRILFVGADFERKGGAGADRRLPCAT